MTQCKVKCACNQQVLFIENVEDGVLDVESLRRCGYDVMIASSLDNEGNLPNGPCFDRTDCCFAKNFSFQAGKQQVDIHQPRGCPTGISEVLHSRGTSEGQTDHEASGSSADLDQIEW